MLHIYRNKKKTTNQHYAHESRYRIDKNDYKEMGYDYKELSVCRINF